MILIHYVYGLDSPLIQKSVDVQVIWLTTSSADSNPPSHLFNNVIYDRSYSFTHHIPTKHYPSHSLPPVIEYTAHIPSPATVHGVYFPDIHSRLNQVSSFLTSCDQAAYIVTIQTLALGLASFREALLCGMAVWVRIVCISIAYPERGLHHGFSL